MEREYTKEEKEDLQKVRDLEELVECKGWKTFVDMLQGFQKEHHMNLLRQSDSIAQVFVGEWSKGAVYGLSQAIELPDRIIAHVRDSIRGTVEKVEEEDV